MIYYDKIAVFEGIYINKTSASKECDVCHYWYFLNYNFKFQANACNRYHNILMMPVNPGEIAILKVKGSDYRCIISLISKKEAINLFQNADLTEKSGTFSTKKRIFFENIYKNEENNDKIWWYWNPKTKFHQHKRRISIKNVDIDKIVVSNKIPFGKKGFKYFTGYKDAKED